MTSLGKTLLKGLLFAVFAVMPFGTSTLSAECAFQDYGVKVENAQVRFGVHYGRPYYWRPHYYGYYSPYYYNYYYYPYRPYHWYNYYRW